jgi:hypothetical protein
MNYKNKGLCKVRTITTFLSLSKDKNTWKDEIFKASTLCSDLSVEFQNNNYIVQSIRIVTNPFGEYLNTDNLNSAKFDLMFLSKLLNSIDTSGMRIRFCYWRGKNIK